MNLKLCRWMTLGSVLILAACDVRPSGFPPLEGDEKGPTGVRPETIEPENGRASEPEHDLAKVTAERRAAGKPDPISVFIDLPQEPLEGSPVYLPELKITLKNVDVELQTFAIQPTDNYRSGRLPKFRVVVKNEQGKEMPPRPRFSPHGGGIIRSYKLAPGETWDTTLNLRGYIEPLLSGQYRLQVLFSDRESIVEMEDISKVVCCQSKTIEFVVRKLALEVSETDAFVVQENIAALDGSEPLRIVAGTYGPWAYGFIAQDSPA